MVGSLLYVGTFPRAYHADAEDVARGISVFRLSPGPATDGSTRVQEQEALRPGWLVRHPARNVIYAVNEVAAVAGRPGGSVTAYSVDPATGRLAELNRLPTAASPCHATVDAAGTSLLVTTFHGSTIHVFALSADGRLGAETDTVVHTGSSVHPVRQRTPHPHAVVLDDRSKYALVPDLGTDRVEVYRFDAMRGALDRLPDAGVSLAPGSGPRHLAFHPNARWAYVVNEMNATITALSFDPATGALNPIQTIAVLPDDVPGYRSAAEILVDSAGRFVYVTHRSHGSSGPRPEGGEDCIAWFRIDAADGRLMRSGRVPSGGAIPRAAVFAAQGAKLLVAHQGDGTIVEFDVDAVDGALRRSGRVIHTPVPVCLLLAAPGGSPSSRS